MAREKAEEGLTSLGAQRTDYGYDYAPEALETFQNQHTDHDYWVRFNCPVFTTLCPITGQPDYGTIYISYMPAERMVESKSLKLYLYSLANTHLGDTTEQVQMAYELIAKEDISRCLGWGVECCFFTEISTYESVLDGYKLLEKSRPFRPNKDRTLKVATHGLATLCPVTGQPDWGTLMLQITGDQLPTREDLFQLLRDLRGKPEFHEDVANRLYEHFQERYEPIALLVACLYTRRGGIDICPVRYSFVDLEPLLLTDTTLLSMPTFRR